MLLTEYDKEREMELLRREERREAKKELLQEVKQEVRQELQQEVRQETEAEVNERVAKDMLIGKFPLESIKTISKLSEAHIRKLAQSLGVAVL